MLAIKKFLVHMPLFGVGGGHSTHKNMQDRLGKSHSALAEAQLKNGSSPSTRNRKKFSPDKDDCYSPDRRPLQ